MLCLAAEVGDQVGEVVGLCPRCARSQDKCDSEAGRQGSSAKMKTVHADFSLCRDIRGEGQSCRSDENFFVTCQRGNGRLDAVFGCQQIVTNLYNSCLLARSSGGCKDSWCHLTQISSVVYFPYGD